MPGISKYGGRPLQVADLADFVIKKTDKSFLKNGYIKIRKLKCEEIICKTFEKKFNNKNLIELKIKQAGENVFTGLSLALFFSLYFPLNAFLKIFFTFYSTCYG